MYNKILIVKSIYIIIIAVLATRPLSIAITLIFITNVLAYI